MTISIPNLSPTRAQWKLNDTLLNDPAHIAQLQENLTNYFAENNALAVSPTQIWEAHKAVLRGHIIALASKHKKAREHQIVTLTEEIRQLEAAHKKSMSLENYKQLLDKRSALQSLLNTKVQRFLLLSKHKYYNRGGKCGRLLARALQKEKQQTYITQIKSSRDTPTHLLPEILQEFHSYYSSLYNLRPQPPDPNDAKQIFTSYLWAGKRHRLPYPTLTRHKSQGGLGVPDIKRYSNAILLARVYDWVDPQIQKQWTQIETTSFTTNPETIPWHDPNTNILRPGHEDHPTITPTLKEWHRLRQNKHISPHPSPLLPITGNPNFPPGLQPEAFRTFENLQGHLHLNEVINENGILPLTAIVRTPTHSIMQKFRYVQLSHYIQRQPDLRQGCRPLTTFESLATSRTLQKKHITTFYNLLQAQDNEQLPTYTKTWENDLGITLTQSEWGKIFTNIFKSSINTTLQECNYKRISRWHLAPTRSYRFSPNTSRVCWSGGILLFPAPTTQARHWGQLLEGWYTQLKRNTLKELLEVRGKSASNKAKRVIIAELMMLDRENMAAATPTIRLAETQRTA
ncbi:Hypothetical predicted protein, partial [Pelobates cultripes]